jgi:hypothetical protein
MTENNVRQQQPQHTSTPIQGTLANSGVQDTALQPLPSDKAELIWEQWRYRHDFFWKALYTVVVTTALISTLPLFKTDILTSLNWFSLAFPLFGLGFGHFGHTLLEAEYRRLGAVGDAYDTAPWSYGTNKHPPYRTEVGDPVGKLLRPAIRAALLWLPVAAATAVSFVLLKPFSP